MDIARQLLPLIAPSCDVSGQLYSVPQGGFVEA
jgi:hypothetical protein